MDPIVSLAEKGNYALGAELVRLKLAEQSQIDSVRLAFDEHLMDGNIKRASILKILTWDMEGVEEKVILDYQIEEFNLGFCSLLSFQIEREALPEFTLKECWATMSVPFDSLSGMFFVSTASYLSREVRKHWEKRLTPNIVWFLSDLSSLTRTLENMENEDEKKLAGGAKSEDVPRDEEEPVEGNQEEAEPAEKGEAVEGNREETEPIDEVSSESARESEEPSPVMPTTAGPEREVS